MSNLEVLIESCIQLGATRAMVTLGVSSGEISHRKARDVYGKYFTDAAKEGRVRPCRIENGHAGTKWYSVEDILKLKAQDAAKAQLKNL